MNVITAMQSGVGCAHGKVILIGEHTVVHGTAAIAVPMSALSVSATAALRNGLPTSPESGSQGDVYKFRQWCRPASQRTEFDSGVQVAVGELLRTYDATDTVGIDVECAIPPGRGLGSSAACAAAAIHATAQLYGQAIDPDSVYELVQHGEAVAHGRASGVDARGAVSDYPFRFRAGTIQPQRWGLEAVLIVADTGVAGSTRRAVESVAALLESDFMQRRRLKHADDLVSAAAEDIAAGRGQALGQRMTQFHRMLADWKVSTPELDLLVAAAEEAGALGAKLTGGGMGGCIVALADGPDRASAVQVALEQAGAVRVWTMPTGQWRMRREEKAGQRT